MRLKGSTVTGPLLAGFGILGVGMAAVLAPVASADPVIPADPATPAAAPAPVTAALVGPESAVPAPSGPAPGPAAVAASASSSITPAASITPPDGVSHLPSPTSLPPGTTQEAPALPDHPTLGYLKDVWTAVRGKQVSPQDALLLIAQRPVDNKQLADSVPSAQGSAPGAAAAVPAAVPAAAADPGDAAAPPVQGAPVIPAAG